jgi:hypothetical protein
LKNAVFWDMMTPGSSCRNQVSEEHSTSILSVKDCESPWSSGRMNLTADGEASHLQRYLHCRVCPLPCGDISSLHNNTVARGALPSSTWGISSMKTKEPQIFSPWRWSFGSYKNHTASSYPRRQHTLLCLPWISILQQSFGPDTIPKYF